MANPPVGDARLAVSPRRGHRSRPMSPGAFGNDLAAASKAGEQAWRGRPPLQRIPRFAPRLQAWRAGAAMTAPQRPCRPSTPRRSSFRAVPGGARGSSSAAQARGRVSARRRNSRLLVAFVTRTHERSRGCAAPQAKAVCHRLAEVSNRRLRPRPRLSIDYELARRGLACCRDDAIRTVRRFLSCGISAAPSRSGLVRMTRMFGHVGGRRPRRSGPARDRDADEPRRCTEIHDDVLDTLCANCARLAHRPSASEMKVRRFT